MEESQKRKERLKALKNEASHSASHDNSDTTILGGFSGLLPGADPTHLAEKECSPTPPRFDFYTDPMSAFSCNKRTKPDTGYLKHQTPSWNDIRGTASSPSSQLGISISHGRPPLMMTPVMVRPGSWRTPCASPLGFCVGSPSSSNHSGLRSREGHLSGYNYPNQKWSFGGNPSPYLRKDRGEFGDTPPSPDSGKGRGQWNVRTPSPHARRSGGGKSHGTVSAVDRPELFYKNSMVEDPWKSLTPVQLNPIGVKKPLMPLNSSPPVPSPLSLDLSSSGQSLAEYLASAFNETEQENSADN